MQGKGNNVLLLLCYCCCLFLVCSAAAAVAAPTKNDVRGVPDDDGGLQPFKCAVVNRNEYESVPA